MRRTIGMICILLFVVVLCACESDHSAPPILPDDPVVTSVPDVNGQEISEQPAEPQNQTGEKNTVQMSVVSVDYYTVDTDNIRLRPSTAIMSSKDASNPMSILSYIVDSLEDESVEIEISDAYIEGDVCVIDFSDSVCVIADKNASLENAILDACAQSILDNIPVVKKICLRIGKAAYKTVNHSFPTDYVYMGR